MKGFEPSTFAMATGRRVAERRRHGRCDNCETRFLAEDECRQRGSELLEINVDGEDTDARRFYERHGYTNREPGPTDPELYYHRDLVPRSVT